MNISLILPTRGRPDSLNRMWDSALSMAKDPKQIEMCLYIDSDDKVLLESEYFNDVLLRNDFVKMVIGPRIVLAQMWNEAFKLSCADILQHGNDDIIFRTRNWDEQVINAFKQYPDKIVFVGGKNGWKDHDNNLFTHGFLSRKWVDAVGYMTPPYFSSDFCDSWLTDVAKGINRFHFVPEFEIEHPHPAFGTAPIDQTHQDRIDRHYKDNVRQKYDDLIMERQDDMAKLVDAIENYRKIEELGL